MQKYQDSILQAGQGSPLPGASVQVNLFPAGTAATIYSDNGFATTANPLTTDAAGRFGFYAVNGHYQLVVSKGGFTTATINDILLEDPVDEGIELSVFSFMSEAQIADVQASTFALDLTAPIQAAHDAAIALGYEVVTFPAGGYKTTAQLNWSPFVAARANGRVVITTNVNGAGATMWRVTAQFGFPIPTATQSGKKLFEGNFTFIHTVNNNTCTCFYFGTTTNDATKMAWGLSVNDVVTQNFNGALRFGFVSFLIKFYNCDFLGSYTPAVQANTFGILQPGPISNGGENISFYGCVFEHLNAVISNSGGIANSGLELRFFGCSCDYNSTLCLNLADNSTYRFIGCHLEWDGTTTLISVNNADWLLDDCYIICPTGTLAAPLVGAVGGGGVLRVRDAHYNLPTPVPALLYFVSDTTSKLTVDQFPDYLFGNVPTAYVSGVAGANLRYFTQTCRKTLTYSASITIDSSQGSEFDITATNGTAFTINAPTNTTDGQRITVKIRNASGGALGVITWNAVFKMLAFTSPTNGNSCSIDFCFDGTNWVQLSPQSLQIPN